MVSDQLIHLLEKVENAKRENRDSVAIIVQRDEKLFAELVFKVFDVNDKLSVRAAWILEWIITHYNLLQLLPHIDYFCKHLSTLQHDSAIRPCAKICEKLATGYIKDNVDIKKALTKKQVDQITEVGFDRLITPQKIAVKAYTMTTLYLLGLEKDWVHPELEHLIRTKIIHESKGCKARGRHVLELIEKHQKSSS